MGARGDAPFHRHPHARGHAGGGFHQHRRTCPFPHAQIGARIPGIDEAAAPETLHQGGGLRGALEVAGGGGGDHLVEQAQVFGHAAGHALDHRGLVQHFGGGRRHREQRLGEGGFPRQVDGAARAGEGDGQAGQHRKLRGEGLGGGNRDFRPRHGLHHHI